MIATAGALAKKAPTCGRGKGSLNRRSCAPPNTKGDKPSPSKQAQLRRPAAPTSRSQSVNLPDEIAETFRRGLLYGSVGGPQLQPDLDEHGAPVDIARPSPKWPLRLGRLARATRITAGTLRKVTPCIGKLQQPRLGVPRRCPLRQFERSYRVVQVPILLGHGTAFQGWRHFHLKGQP
ncbi:MAG TPA: hypothetical protein VGF60_06060 [Xanthobacteraceae bacterium]|jgi:hypothetical protein